MSTSLLDAPMKLREQKYVLAILVKKMTFGKEEGEEAKAKAKALGECLLLSASTCYSLRENVDARA